MRVFFYFFNKLWSRRLLSYKIMIISRYMFTWDFYYFLLSYILATSLTQRKLQLNPSSDRTFSRPIPTHSARPDTLIPRDCLLTRPRHDLIDSSFSRGRLERRQETTCILANCSCPKTECPSAAPHHLPSVVLDTSYELATTTESNPISSTT